MKVAVLFLRLIFAAWMIPAGLNHFYPLFPQPLGNQPESREMLLALLDTNLFTLVKAVELGAGLCLLTGFYVPLALVLVMPVSFCVFYWDTALQGWTSGSAIYGWSVLVSNLLLCLAYFESYRPMFVLRAQAGRRLVLIGQLVLGAWMLASGINHFFVPLWPAPTGATPLAAQLVTALANSELINVVMAVQLVGGALLLAGLFVPVALCVLMPLSVCAAYWAVFLDRQPLWIALAIAALALNGLLMLAYLPAYKGVLQRRALAIGETEETSYESLFVNPFGRTSGRAFLVATIPLIAAFVLYLFVAPAIGRFCWPVLLIPAAVLVSRRLRDMTSTA